MSGRGRVGVAFVVDRAGRRQFWAVLFDEHASALLVLANLLVDDAAVAEAITGRVLVQYRPSPPVDVQSQSARLVLALAVVAECQRFDDYQDVFVNRRRIAVVGLARFARLSYRQVASDMVCPSRREWSCSEADCSACKGDGNPSAVEVTTLETATAETATA